MQRHSSVLDLDNNSQNRTVVTLPPLVLDYTLLMPKNLFCPNSWQTSRSHFLDLDILIVLAGPNTYPYPILIHWFHVLIQESRIGLDAYSNKFSSFTNSELIAYPLFGKIFSFSLFHQLKSFSYLFDTWKISVLLSLTFTLAATICWYIELKQGRNGINVN